MHFARSVRRAAELAANVVWSTVVAISRWSQEDDPVGAADFICTFGFDFHSATCIRTYVYGSLSPYTNFKGEAGSFDDHPLINYYCLLTYRLIKYLQGSK